MSFIRQRPMIECTSCGRQVGHLIIPYKKCLSNLDKQHKQLLEGTVTFQSFLDGLVDSDREVWDKLKLRNYLEPYYQWYQSNSEFELSSAGLLAHAFLTYLDLDEPVDATTVFPLYMNSFYATRYCCLRMLHCDNTPHW